MPIIISSKGREGQYQIATLLNRSIDWLRGASDSEEVLVVQALDRLVLTRLNFASAHGAHLGVEHVAGGP